MSKKKRIFIYPEEGSSNLYLTACRSNFEKNGHSVQSLPASLPKLLKMISCKENIIVLNWFEDRLGHASSQIVGFIKSIVVLVLVRLIFRRVIWVRHNLKPHNECSKRFYSGLLFSLDKLSDCQVTHRPVKGLDSYYVPHPLYPACQTESNTARDIPFLYFGVVKHYKGLDKLLEQWPVFVPLVMVGKCDNEDLIAQLNGIIKSRALDVQWRNEFIDYNELSSLIQRSEAVILPHADNSMIVSGAFYHAISFGANVLIRDGDLYQNYLKRFDFVTAFDNENLLSTINKYIPTSSGFIKQRALSEFSDKALAAAWDEVFDGY